MYKIQFTGEMKQQAKKEHEIVMFQSNKIDMKCFFLLFFLVKRWMSIFLHPTNQEIK